MSVEWSRQVFPTAIELLYHALWYIEITGTGNSYSLAKVELEITLSVQWCNHATIKHMQQRNQSLQQQFHLNSSDSWISFVIGSSVCSSSYSTSSTSSTLNDSRTNFSFCNSSCTTSSTSSTDRSFIYLIIPLTQHH